MFKAYSSFQQSSNDQQIVERSWIYPHETSEWWWWWWCPSVPDFCV